MIEFVVGLFFGFVFACLLGHYVGTRRAEREARRHAQEAARFTAKTDQYSPTWGWAVDENRTREPHER
jgi:hypothetical protein